MLCTDGCLSQVLAVFESFVLYLHACWQRYRCKAVAAFEGVRVDEFQVCRHRNLCQSCVLEGVLPNGRYRLREVDVDVDMEWCFDMLRDGRIFFEPFGA